MLPPDTLIETIKLLSNTFFLKMHIFVNHGGYVTF